MVLNDPNLSKQSLSSTRSDGTVINGHVVLHTFATRVDNYVPRSFKPVSTKACGSVAALNSTLIKLCRGLTASYSDAFPLKASIHLLSEYGPITTNIAARKNGSRTWHFTRIFKLNPDSTTPYGDLYVQMKTRISLRLPRFWCLKGFRSVPGGRV